VYESVKLVPSDVSTRVVRLAEDLGQQVKDFRFSEIYVGLVGVSVPQERWAVLFILMVDSFTPGDAVELDLLHSDVLHLPLTLIFFSCEVKPHAGRLRGKESPILLQLELELERSVSVRPVKVDRIKFLPYLAFWVVIADANGVWVLSVIRGGLDGNAGNHSTLRKVFAIDEVESDPSFAFWFFLIHPPGQPSAPVVVVVSEYIVDREPVVFNSFGGGDNGVLRQSFNQAFVACAVSIV